MKHTNLNPTIAVTGHRGRLGSELVRAGCIPLECDITSPKEVISVISDLNPDVLIHCAAITDVDECELSLFSKATIVNGTSINIIRNNFNGRFIYISTDYVFDGKNGPYSEYSLPNPICQYGNSKLFGEEVLREFDLPYDTIVRTTILYGGCSKKLDFVSTVLDAISKDIPVELPTNLFGNPTYIPHLVEALLFLAITKSPPKILNVAGDGVISRYEFGLMIANIFGYDRKSVV